MLVVVAGLLVAGMVAVGLSFYVHARRASAAVRRGAVIEMPRAKPRKIVFSEAMRQQYANLPPDIQAAVDEACQQLATAEDPTQLEGVEPITEEDAARIARDPRIGRTEREH